MDLEQQILSKVNEGVSKAIIEAITGYASPLTLYAKQTIEKHAGEIQTIMDSALTQTISSKEFKLAVKECFTHKLAKTLMAKMEGEVEKAATLFRQDPVRRAKVIAIIEKIIQEQE